MKHVMQADLKLGRRNIVSAVNKLLSRLRSLDKSYHFSLLFAEFERCCHLFFFACRREAVGLVTHSYLVLSHRSVDVPAVCRLLNMCA